MLSFYFEERILWFYYLNRYIPYGLGSTASCEQREVHVVVRILRLQTAHPRLHLPLCRVGSPESDISFLLALKIDKIK